MPGETKADVSSWTVDSLHAHLMKIMDERDRRYAVTHNALDAKIDELNKTGHATIESRIAAVQREIEADTEANKAAVDKVALATEKRFDSVNEFRAQLKDQAATFITRQEVMSVFAQFNEKSEQRFDTNGDKISALDKRLDRNEGRGTGLNQGWGYLVGAVGLVGVLIAIAVALFK